MSGKRTIILGAGPAGLTAAWELTRHGAADVLVLEADPKEVGGISRTVERDGFRFDIGGHRFFSKSAEINAVWREILPEEFGECPRLSRIYYRNRFFSYPLEPLDAFLKLGPLETLRVMLSYLRARLAPVRPEASFADWVSNRFGRRLFEIFFRSYTEKVWGIPCSEISADWAAQRIKGLSLRSAIWSAFQGRRGSAAAKTLIREFHYPRLGPGQMWETAARKVREAGGRVELDREVRDLYWNEPGGLRVAGAGRDGAPFEASGDRVISSMPLRDLVLALRPAPPEEVLAAARALRYRDFITVCLVVARAEIFPDIWIYIHDPAVKVGRVQNFKNWSRALVPDPALTTLGLEYFCFEGDGLWTASEAELHALAVREVAQIGLAAPDEVRQGYVVRMPKAYPVYDQAYREHVATIRDWLQRYVPALQPVGRNGMHHYNNQDHSMMTGLLAARNIEADADRYDCWKVNTDAEYHEA